MENLDSNRKEYIMNDSTISRRSFLRGAALLAAMIPMGGILSARLGFGLRVVTI